MQPPWIVFPPHFSAPTVRSLCLLFILEELSRQFPKTTPTQDLSAIEEVLGLKMLLPPYPLIPDKLCFYCCILLKTSQVDGKNLQKILETIRFAVLQCRSEILQNTLLWEKIDVLWTIWKEQLVAFFIALIPFLHEARTDENVLLALCEYAPIFNEYLGSKTIEEILESFFPQGDLDWQAVLVEGFQRRHFSEFLHSQQHLLPEVCVDVLRSH